MKSLFVWMLLVAFTPVCCLARDAAPDSKLVVEDVLCRGNAITSCQFIRAQLYLSIGSPVNEEEIGNAKLRLSLQPNFTSVHIYLEKGADNGKVVVVIEVSEADPIAKEFVLGALSRLGSFGANVEGRISNNNLFGAGKILDFDAAAIAPLNEPTRRGVFSRLQFVDPNILGASRYFLISGVSYIDSLTEYPNGDFYKAHRLGLDLTIGRRLFDFSYITLGYQYRPIANSSSEYWYRPVAGTRKQESDTNKNALFIAYGWNSENDAYFPTQGSRFYWSFGASGGINDQQYNSVVYRKTWTSAGNSIWAVQLGGITNSEYRSAFDETPLVSVTYARPISASDRYGGLKQGRWYIEPSAGFYGQSSDGDSLWEVGIKAGVRLDTKSFGVVNLYLLGSTSATRGDN